MAGQAVTESEKTLAADWQRALRHRLALPDGDRLQTADFARLISLGDSLPNNVRRSPVIAFEAAAISLFREHGEQMKDGD
jgi:hypothetical protein